VILYQRHIFFSVKMPLFEPRKRHLREVLLYFFSMKKSAIESYQLLVETYDEAVLNETTVTGFYASKLVILM